MTNTVVKIGVDSSFNPSSGAAVNSGWNALTSSIDVVGNVAANPSTNNLGEYVKSVVGHSSGYRYAELTITEQGAGTGQWAGGVVSGSPSQSWLGNNANSLGAWVGANLWNNGSIVTSTAGMAEPDVLRIWQRDGQRIWMEYHNGVTNTMIGGGDPSTDTTPTLTFASAGTIYIAFTPYGNTTTQAIGTLATTDAEFVYGKEGADPWE